MSSGVARFVGPIVALAVLATSAPAVNQIWDNNPGGDWGNPANWSLGAVPGVNDTATFNLTQTYTVNFAADPAVIQSLLVSAGNVTMQSSGGARTLSLTAGAGGQDVVVNGPTTTLTLGAPGNPLHIVAGDDLSVQSGATLVAAAGSTIVANDFSAIGLNGTLRFDGAGSILTVSGGEAKLIGNSGTGTLTFQNASTGNSINGPLGIANSATQGIAGTLSILSGSSLTLGGNLSLSNQNLVGQIATLAINGTNSILTQSGGAATTIGSAANGTATVAIGTTNSGGAFNAGTGTFTIHKTGTVTIGSGTNTGSLAIGGDLAINGGVLQKMNAGSVLDLAAGRSVTIQGGGRLSLAGPHVADENQIYNLSGAASKLEVTGTNALTIRDGAQINLAAGTALSAGGRIDVGTSAASAGTLSVAGSGTTVTGGSELNAWGSSGGTANVTFASAAVGTFNSGINLANSSTAGTTATVSVLSQAVLDTGSLNLATVGGTTTAATLNIQGADSRVTQSGTATLTVGHTSEGTATINVGTTAGGAQLTTGSGLFRINKTGTVSIGSGANGGTLEVLGNIQVDGGTLQELSNQSTFAWTTGKTLTIQNGGRVSFASSYTTAASAQHLITGANSRFEVASTIQLRGAAQIGVSAGGRIAAGQVHVGGGGTAGSLVVDGADSSLMSTGTNNNWGSGGAATVTLSNQAKATLAGSLDVATTAGATVSVISGADLATGDLALANAGGAASATLSVLGVGSTATLGPAKNLVVGHAANGSATIQLDDGGLLALAAGGATTLNATGTINIGAGTADLRALAVVGGTINLNGGKLAFTSLSVNGGAIKFNSGRIEQTGNLTADDALLTMLLGPTHELASGRTLAAGGGTVHLSSRLELNGGRLEGNSLNVTNSGPNATVLRIRGGGVAQFAAGGSLAAGSNTFLEDGSSLVAGGQITQASELQLTGTGRIAASTLVNSGLIAGSGRIDANLQNQSAGQLRIAAGRRVLVNGTNHLNNGLIEVAGGELEIGTGAFVNGNANPATATIAARDAAIRFGGGATNTGSILCTAGSCNLFGNLFNAASPPATGRIIISAGAQATFFGNVANHGTIQVSRAGPVESTALFLGSLSGNGVAGSGSVFVEGDLEPGAPIGTMAFGGDLSIGAAAVVSMALGGIAPTQFDRITTVGAFSLGGTLALSLASGFTPLAGQSFDLFDWGTRTGNFSALELPTLTGLSWNTSQLYTTGTIHVVSALPGDFNASGKVDAADYSVWRNGLGTLYTQSDYAIWKAHFGQSLPGSGAGAPSSVPEPATIVLLAALMLSAVRRPRRAGRTS